MWNRCATGRSFSARRVNVTQSDGAILTAIASFQEHGQHGVEFSDPMPEDVPAPETLTSARELMQPFADQSPFARYYAEKSPFDIRHVTRTVMLGADKKSAANDSGKQMVWMRAAVRWRRRRSCTRRCWRWGAIRSCWSRSCDVRG